MELPFARAAGMKLIEGRVVAQATGGRATCDLNKVVSRQLEPSNMKGCVALDDVEVVAYDRHRNIVASALTYASERPDGPAHGYYYLQVPPGAYRLVFKRDGFVNSRASVHVTKRAARGARAWGALEEADVRTRLQVLPRKNRKVWAMCEQVRISFDVAYIDPRPSGYPKAPTGKARTTEHGRTLLQGHLKTKWGGHITATHRYGQFKPGKHSVWIHYDGQRHPGGRADVGASRDRWTFRVLPYCDARPGTDPAAGMTQQ